MAIYCIDIDGTLCTKSEDDYSKAIPFEERISTVNKLYDEGHEIIIFVNEVPRFPRFFCLIFSINVA